MSSIAGTSRSVEGRMTMCLAASTMPADPGFKAKACAPTPISKLRRLAADRRNLFAHDVRVEADRAVRLDLAVDALDLGFEARKQIGAALEHFQIVEHGLRPLGQTLARHDRAD